MKIIKKIYLYIQKDKFMYTKIIIISTFLIFFNKFYENVY